MKSRTLITGANGFVGRHLADALLGSGHQVVCGVRELPESSHAHYEYVKMDFTQDFSPELWAFRLKDIDVVINTVGIMSQGPGQTFDALHIKSPCALFKACEQAKTRLVIQFSALGADEHSESQYHRTKKQADDYLRSLDVCSAILQPSLIFGIDGSSTRFFSLLASLPIVGLPGGGNQLIQPVHIHDVEKLVLAMIDGHPSSSITVPVVGSQPLSMASYLKFLREGMKLGRLYTFALPKTLIAIVARGNRRGFLNSETLAMLDRGNVGNPQQMISFTQSTPIPPEKFIGGSEAELLRTASLLGWLLPLLRFTLAIVWIYTGIISLGIYPQTDSLALLNKAGLHGKLAVVALYGAALMDIVLGVATLLMTRRRILWILQIMVISVYSMIIIWKMPEFLVHPFGPLVKNIPMIGIIFMLLKLEENHGLHRR